MKSLEQEPYNCFEELTSVNWHFNVVTQRKKNCEIVTNSSFCCWVHNLIVVYTVLLNNIVLYGQGEPKPNISPIPFLHGAS